MKKYYEPEERGYDLSLGGLLSAMSAYSDYRRQEREKRSERQRTQRRRARFELPEIGDGMLAIFALIPVILVTIKYYATEAKAESERTYYQIEEPQEYAVPSKKQVAALVKDTLIHDYYTFKDDCGREFYVYVSEGYCTAEYNGEFLAGMSLENAILWNQTTLGIYDGASLQSFIAASKAAVGG